MAWLAHCLRWLGVTCPLLFLARHRAAARLLEGGLVRLSAPLLRAVPSNSFSQDRLRILLASPFGLRLFASCLILLPATFCTSFVVALSLCRWWP